MTTDAENADNGQSNSNASSATNSHYAKKQLEREAVDLFIKLYNQSVSNRLRLLYQREKPDAVLMNNKGDKLGLEITHLFYSEQEARQLFQREHRSILCVESIETLIESLNQLVLRKEAKSSGYSSDYPLALLIRNLSPSFGWSDFNEAWDQVRTPSLAFTEVWLLTKERPDNHQWYLKALRSSR